MADRDFGMPGKVDMLLGVNVYGRGVLYGRRFGPSGSPMAVKKRFGWVLSGLTLGKSKSKQIVCCVSVASCDQELRLFGPR